MENCGPIRVEHDDQTGRTGIAAKFDPLAFLRHRGQRGATAAEAAIAKFEKSKPTEAEVVRARRELDRLVREIPQVTRDAAQIGGDGGSKGARYRYGDGIEHLDSPPTRPPTQGFAP
jgi:hypothetical protein